MSPVESAAVRRLFARCFCALGIPVHDADQAAKELYDRDPELMRSVRDAFGDTILDPEGKLDRKKLAELVFADPEKLQSTQLAGTSPCTGGFSKWVKLQTHAPYVIREAAILFESGTHKDCDKGDHGDSSCRATDATCKTA